MITVTVPDNFCAHEVADYLREVAEQIEEGLLSGHVAVDHYWGMSSSIENCGA